MRQYSFLDSGRVRQALGRIAEAAANQAPETALHLAKNCLNGGELSPQMAARHDQQRFQTGFHYLLNMCPLPTGGICKRPPLLHVEQLPAGARLLPFIFSRAQSRLLVLVEEAGETSLRVYDTSGELLFSGLPLPWPAGIAREVCFCQSADVIFCAHPKIRPGKIMRHADADWRYETISWLPAIARPRITSIATAGDASDTSVGAWRSYAVTAVDASTGEESLPAYTSIHSHPLSQSYYIVLTVAAQAQASEFRVYKKNAGVYGFIGRITGGTTFEDRNIAADTEDTPPSPRDPFAAENERPALVFMHQQRLGFAASDARPLTVWLSQAGNYESMAASIPPDADDAIEATLAAPEANRILWAQSDRTGLALGTEGGEWLLAASEGAAITPADLSFQPQTYFGSEPGIPVLRAGASLLFCQRAGAAIREFGYSFAEDRYASNDLSLLARHILRQNPIRAWCWQPEPYGIAWCALADGAMAGLTYLREHDVIAWHRHKTRGEVRDVASIPAPGGDWQVWLLVERDGAICLERLAPFHEDAAPFLDGAGQLPFEARAIPTLPEIQQETGSSLGLLKKFNAIKCRVLNSTPFSAKVTSPGAPDAGPFPVPARPAAFANEAEWAAPLAAGYRELPKLELIFDGPGPATLLALTISMELSTQTGNP